MLNLNRQRNKSWFLGILNLILKHKNHKTTKPKHRRILGFTVIELMLVLAIAGLIMVVVFRSISEAGAKTRDHQRKEYARLVLESLQEYYKNNGQYPENSTEASKFLSVYMPTSKDPSTGNDYKSTALTTYPGGAVGTTTGSAVYYYDNSQVEHNRMPKIGEIYIATAHWCYVTRPDGGDGPPLAGNGADNNLSVFSVVMYQEHGGFYCLDNYASSGADL